MYKVSKLVQIFSFTAVSALFVGTVAVAAPKKAPEGTRPGESSHTKPGGARGEIVSGSGAAHEYVAPAEVPLVAKDFSSPAEWAGSGDVATVETAGKIFATIKAAQQKGENPNGADGFISEFNVKSLLTYLQQYVPAKGQKANAVYEKLSNLLASSNPQSKALIGFVDELMDKMKASGEISSDGTIKPEGLKKLNTLFTQKLPQEWSATALHNAAAFVGRYTDPRTVAKRFDEHVKSLPREQAKALASIQDLDNAGDKTRAMQEVLYKADLEKMFAEQVNPETGKKYTEAERKDAVRQVCECTGSCT